jgi:hypothetical protein
MNESKCVYLEFVNIDAETLSKYWESIFKHYIGAGPIDIYMLSKESNPPTILFYEMGPTRHTSELKNAFQHEGIDIFLHTTGPQPGVAGPSPRVNIIKAGFPTPDGQNL